MSSRQFLKDAAARHAVFVQRFGGGQVKKTLAYITKLKAQIAARLAGEDMTELSAARLKVIYNDLTDLTEALYTKMGKEILDDLQEFARFETEFTQKLAKQGMSVEEFALPSLETLQAAIKSKPMEFTPKLGGGTLGSALKQFKTAKAKQIVQVVKDGAVLGKTTQEIISDVNHLASTTQRNNLDALVRTMVNHISSVARQATFKKNEDVLEGYEVVATLDQFTCLYCASIDGKKYTLDDVEWPPYHFNCRCILVPIVKKEYDLGAEVTGERPSVGDSGAETVGANVNFGKWLSGQSASFQKEYFSKFGNGDEKYKLFKSGGLKLDRFVDAKGAAYTLDELRERSPLAFKKAGLND